MSEASANRTENELQLLLSLTLAVSTSKDIEEALDLILEKICETTGWAAGDAWFYDELTDSMRFRVAYYKKGAGLSEFGEMSENLAFKKGEGLPGIAWKRNNAVWIENLLQEPAFTRREEAEKLGLKTGLAIPISINEEILAALAFYLAEQTPENGHLLNLVAAAAGQLGLLLRQKLAEDKLKESELKFLALMRSSNEAIIIADERSRILAANPASLQIFGYKTENELLGQDLTILMPERYRNIHRHGMKRYIRTHEPHVIGQTVEVEGRNKDGSEFPIELSISSYEVDNKFYFSGIIRDISERKKAEKAIIAKNEQLEVTLLTLKESEERFRLLAENSSDIISRHDHNAQYIYVSPSIHRIQGYMPEDVIGKTLYDFVHPDDLELLQEVYAKMFQSEGIFNMTVRFRHKDGHYLWFESSVNVILDKDTGLPLEAQSIARDVTQRKEAEIQLLQRNSDLEQFAYVASHDLKEPLRMIASYSKLLLKRLKEPDPDMVEFSTYIQEGVSRMQALINDLLEYSKIGRIPEEFQEVDVNNILKEVMDDLQVKIAETDTIIECEKLPLVWGISSQIKQLIQNLIENSIKFKKKQDTPRIEISAQRRFHNWLIMVKDNGIGIDEKYSEKVFTIFQRLHQREEYPGTGIGLAICKKIIENHGGKIWFSSRPGEGVTFYFTLEAV